jgi:hypothetical protein
MTCTFPFFKDWLEKNFGDLCEQHDFDYVQRVWIRKVASDYEFCAKVASKGYALLALGALVYFKTVGTLYWLWKKYK